ncbi:MAG TPA: A/G-specific adenine glycosylase [Bacillales bacterium]|nr:A/G-specific adenine glycosylase [Bacillales bacterium]
MNKKGFDTIEKNKFAQRLTSWFDQQQRPLPWREDRDPYKIWVSEIMLQQTRVDTVIPYFRRFITRFPTIESLANADQEEVLKHWEGLGYYSRARNLHAGVREVHAKYGSRVPDQADEISAIKGIGPYTAGAILSIAFGKPEPAVDGNVMRVLSRVLLVEDDIAKQKTRKYFEQVVKAIIPEDDPSAFNQGLMELGATVCTPKSPKCLLCPVRQHCQAFQENRQAELPVKSKSKAPKVETIAVAAVQNENGEWLIRRRPETGLLGGMWEFPAFKVDTALNKKAQLAQKMCEMYELKVELHDRLRNIQHVFSHLKWEMSVYRGTVEGTVQQEGHLFCGSSMLEKYPFPVSHQKIIRMITER